MSAPYLLFSREEAGLPKIVTTVALNPEERPNLPFQVTARLPYQAKDNGLPVNDELNRVARIEDQLVEALKPLGGLHLGHITSAGAMLVAFRMPEKAPVEITVKTGLLRKEQVELISRHDPEWVWYETEMAPDEIESEMGRNQQLLITLQEHGDQHQKPRPVDFGAFFPTADARSAFLAAIHADGYRLTPVGIWEPEGTNSFWCEVVIETDVQPRSIATRCAYLRRQARQQGGDFDGWATPIVSG